MNWWLKLRRRRQLEKDLTDEIAFHRAMREADAGAPPFGNPARIHEATRELWRLQWLETIWRDTVYAFRALRSQPGFTAVVVLTLALGIGANTAVFSVVNGVMLRPLGYPEPERLEFVMTQFPGLGFDRFAMSLPEFVEFRDHNTAFESAGAYVTGRVTLGTSQPTRPLAAAVTPDLLTTLNVRPALGRWFDSSDAQPGANRTMMLSDGLWKREFGADPGLIDRRLDIGGASVLVVGVMPPGFDVHDQKVDVWLPLTIDPAQLQRARIEHNFRVIARRRSGVTRLQAQADLDRLVARWKEIAPEGHTPVDPGHRVAMMPLLDSVVGEVGGTLWMLQAAVGVVLLIACVNLANLLIARADSRTHEHALRVALGASRRRLLQQLTTEGLVLAALAAIVGLALAQAGVPLLLASFPDAIPRTVDVRLDWRVLGFTAAMTVATALVFGLVPFAHLARERAGDLLRDSSHRMTPGVIRARVRSALIVIEVALAVLLVVGAGLLLRSFVNLTKVDVGFGRAGLSTFSVALPDGRYDPSRRAQFHRQLIEGLEALPGVERAAVTTGLPPQRGMNSSDTDFAHIPPDRPDGEGPAENVDFFQSVSLGYVKALGGRVISGRDFEPGDVGGAPVVLVNEALVRRFFKGLNPIGQQLRPGLNGRLPWFTIVGVLGDVKQAGVAADAGTEVTFLIEQRLRLDNQVPGSVHALIRSPLPLEALAPQFREVVSALDAALPLTEMRTMDQTISGTVERPRFLLLLLGLLAGLALVLAAVGIYGILAYLVAERRQEIGVRMALGASRWTVVRMILTRGLGAAAVGVGCGLAGSVALTGVLSSLLFGVTPTDPPTLAAVSAVILIVAAAACVVPSWRATRVSPMSALRS